MVFIFRLILYGEVEVSLGLNVAVSEINTKVVWTFLYILA